MRKGVLDAPPDDLRNAKRHLTVALRARADLYVNLAETATPSPTGQASELAERGNP